MLTMKKQQIRISNQEEFNKHLQHTSPATWIVLGLVVALLIAFFAWSFLFKLTVRFSGQADIVGGEVTLHITNSSLRKIKVGSKIYINDIKGEIVSFTDNKPVVSNFALEDGEYTYVAVGESRPIDFLLNK